MTDTKLFTVDEILAEICRSAAGQRTAAIAAAQDLATFSFYVQPAVASWILRLGAHHPAFMQSLQLHPPILAAIYSPTTDLLGLLVGIPVRIRRLVPDGHLMLWPDDVVRRMDRGETQWPVAAPASDKFN